MEKTNNFKDKGDGKEIWIKIGDWILKVFYDKGCWWESIKQENSRLEALYKCKEDMETIYLNYCISVYEIYCKQKTDNIIDFAERQIGFGYDKDYFKDNVTIQIGEQDEEGVYAIDPLQIDREKWLEIAEFFNHASLMYLTFDSLMGDG